MAVMEEVVSAKLWRVCAEEEVAASPERVWNVVSQFCGAHVWSASLESCEKLEGEERTPGCIRLCTGRSDFSTGGIYVSHVPGNEQVLEQAAVAASWPAIPSVCNRNMPAATKQPKMNWSKEKLLCLDESLMLLSYSVLDSNLGLRNYSATFQVLPRHCCAASSASSTHEHDSSFFSCSCILRWRAQLDPVLSTTETRLGRLLQAHFRRNAEKLREVLGILPASGYK